jgi:hypothetical protein
MNARRSRARADRRFARIGGRRHRVELDARVGRREDIRGRIGPHVFERAAVEINPAAARKEKRNEKNEKGFHAPKDAGKTNGFTVNPSPRWPSNEAGPGATDIARGRVRS